MFPCGVSFLMFLTKFFSKCPSSTNLPPFPSPEKFLVAQLHSGIILCAERSILNVWQCSEYVLCNASDTFWHIQHSVFSGICWHIQSYSASLRHIRKYWDIILAFSGLLSAPHKAHIFTILLYIYWAYLKPCETLTRHIKNPAIGHYSATLKTLYNACIRRNLAYTQSWNIQNPSIITSQSIFRTLSY